MSLSMFEISVPTLLKYLNRLDLMLDRAQALADEKKFDSAVLMAARLAPDMLPVSRQIQIATDNAKGCVARLAGIEPPKMDDVETTVAELKARLAKTADFIKSVPRAQVDGSEDRDIVLKFPTRTLDFKGKGYVIDFVLPNFLFHVVTTYAILRHNGVTLGKLDYLGG